MAVAVAVVVEVMTHLEAAAELVEMVEMDLTVTMVGKVREILGISFAPMEDLVAPSPDQESLAAE